MLLEAAQRPRLGGHATSAALAGRHPVARRSAATRPGRGWCAPTTRTSCIRAAAAIEERARHAHDLHPDLALLLSAPRARPGRPSWSGSRGTTWSANARQHRRLPRASRADRPGDHLAAAALLLRPLGAQQPPGVGAAVVLTDLSVADECFWDLAARHGVTAFAGVPYTFDLLDASGFADRELPVAALPHPGRRPDAARAGASRYAELGRERGLGPVRDVRPDRGHRPDGLPAARPGAARARGRSASRSPAATSASSPSPAWTTRGVGELVYTGPERDDGVRRERRRPRPRTRADRAAHRRPRPAGRRRALGGRRPASTGSPRSSGCASTSTGSSASWPHGSAAVVVVRGDRTCTSSPTRPAARGRIEALGTALVGPAGRAPSHVHRLDRLPPHDRTGKPDYAAPRRHAALLADAADDQSTARGRSRRSMRVTSTPPCCGAPTRTTGDSFVALGGDSLSFVEVVARLGGASAPARGLAAPHLAELAATRADPAAWCDAVEMPVLLRRVWPSSLDRRRATPTCGPGPGRRPRAARGGRLQPRPVRSARPCPDPGRAGMLGGRRRGRAPGGRLDRRGSPGRRPATYRPATALLLNQVVWAATAGPTTGSSGSSRHWSGSTSAGRPAAARARRSTGWQRRPSVRSGRRGGRGATLAVRTCGPASRPAPPSATRSACVLWCLALGWAAAEAQRPAPACWSCAARGRASRRSASSATPTARRSSPGRLRPALVWSGRLPAPAAAPGCRRGRRASLWIYLTHWQVYPGLEAAGHPSWRSSRRSSSASLFGERGSSSVVGSELGGH